MRRGVGGGGVTDRRVTNCDDEPRARDRISALAHGFRNLSEKLDRRYQRVAWLCIACAVISLGTLIGTVLVERQRAREQATRALTVATKRLDGAVRGSCVRLQAEREHVNGLQATVYLVLKAAAVASRDPAARRQYVASTAATVWSPPANCARAVDDPTHYRSPPVVPFSKLPAGYATRVVAAARDGRPQPMP
jgi:hypothetical protein